MNTEQKDRHARDAAVPNSLAFEHIGQSTTTAPVGAPQALPRAASASALRLAYIRKQFGLAGSTAKLICGFLWNDEVRGGAHDFA